MCLNKILVKQDAECLPYMGLLHDLSSIAERLRAAKIRKKIADLLLA